MMRTTKLGLTLVPLLMATLLTACSGGQIRVNGKPVQTDDGAEAAQQYYAPQFRRLKRRPAPLPIAAVFAEPNKPYAAANWVKGGSRVSIEKRNFFRDFARTSWLVLAAALDKGGVFKSLRRVKTTAGTSDLSSDANVAPGTVVVRFNTGNRIVVYRHPHREQGIAITEKLSPGHELEMMTNLIVAKVKRLPPHRAPKPRPTVVGVSPPSTLVKGPIVAVFDAQSSRIKVSAELRRSLADHAAMQLAATRHYRVIPRAQVKARLRQQKRASYRACFDAACRVEIGRELAAQKSLAITIVKLGSRCDVSLMLFDLKQAASERAAMAGGPCNEKGYVSSIRMAISKLVEPKSSPPR